MDEITREASIASSREGSSASQVMMFDSSRGQRAEPKEPLTMLIVEDDLDLLAEMVRFVRKELRMNAYGADDYYGAVLQLARGIPDVASIDLKLPRESGYDLCVYLRARPGSSQIPILVTGEVAVPAELAQAEEAGANLFLEKPFSMRELAVNITALIERPKLSRPGLRLLRLF